MRVAPAAANRMVDGARGVLNTLLADVFVFTDAMAGAEAGASPGYGIALVAETTAGLFLGAQATAPPPAPQACYPDPVCCPSDWNVAQGPLLHSAPVCCIAKLNVGQTIYFAAMPFDLKGE